MERQKKNVTLALFPLALLVLAGAAVNCFANPDFGRLTLEVMGEEADLDALRLSVMTAAAVAALLMCLTGWQLSRGRNPHMTFVLALASTILITVLTVYSRQQGGSFLSRAANTVGMICSFLAVTIANRERP